MMFRVLATLLLIAVIAGSFWLGGQQRETAAPTTIGTASTDLGYSARDATLMETGPDGLPMYTLNATLIRQHPDNDVEFEQVQMTFRDTDGQIWKGRADRGQLATSTGKVGLTGNVQVTGLLPGLAQVAELTTQVLSVDTRENIISTAEPVVVTTTGRILKSDGLQAILKEHHLILESNVSGTFTP